MSDERDETKQPRIVWMEVEPVVGKPKLPWYQFRLIELFVVVTIACVAFAALGAFGVDGTLQRIEGALCIASPFLPLFEFWIWWRKHTEE